MTHTECVESESSEKVAKSAIYIDTVINTRSFTIVVSIFLTTAVIELSIAVWFWGMLH